jgi:hypothetical protein
MGAGAWHRHPLPRALVPVAQPVEADDRPPGLRRWRQPRPDPTHGKDPEKAKELEKDWDYPKHLAGRAYGLFVHGDVVGAEHTRRSIAEWLDWMGLRRSGPQSQLDRYIGYFKPYATSHEDLDADQPVFKEVRNIAKAVLNAATQIRSGGLKPPDEDIEPARMK